MYGFPDSIDPNQLVDTALVAVTYSSNSIHLDFSKWGVTVFGRLDIETIAGVQHTETPPVEISKLVGVVGQSVVAACLQGTRTLELRMSDGSRIRLVDDSVEFESLILRLEDTEYIV